MGRPMKHWCPGLQKLASNPPREECKDPLCGMGWYLRKRKEFRDRKETEWSWEEKVPLSDITRYLICPFFLPGIVMLFWVPFILLVASYPFQLGLLSLITHVGVCLLLSLALHETGHIFATRLLNVEIEEWKLVPIGVGFKADESADLDRMLKVYSAGPVMNLLAASVAVLGQSTPFFYFLALASLFLFLMNSLPNRGSDGFQIIMRLADSVEEYPYLIAVSMFVSGPLLAALLVFFLQ